MDIKLQSFDPLDSSSHQTGICCSIPSRKPTKLCHYTTRRQRQREGNTTRIRTQRRSIVEIVEGRNASFRNYKRLKSGSGGKGGVLSICPFASFLSNIPIQIHREERTRGIIRLLGGMQSGRLWGTEIAGLEERLGLVARFQKTNVPLEVEEERSSSPCSRRYSSRWI